MAEDKKLYQQILKSTTLFGGVQILTILLSVVRTKAIALLIGPAGIGIAGLLNGAINVIGGLTSVGLETSAVKYISQENTSADKAALARIIAVAKKAVWVSGIAGACLTIALSHWLSRLTFDSSEYTYWFIYVAAALLFKQLTVGNIAILQGLQKLKHLAKANLFGSAFGLLFSLPLYYYFDVGGIVPAIIISAAATFFLSWYYSKKVEIQKVALSNKQLFTEGRAMLRLGIMLSITGLLSTFVLYLIQIYVSKSSDLTQVGLYNAGIMLLNSYVALIFSAMGTDFFPRLAAISHDNVKVRKTVQHQAQIAVLLLAPIIVLFITFAPIVVGVLFSTDFLAIIPMVSIGILGMLFRAVSWSMGYILLAKGDSPMFIRTAFGFNALFLLLSTTGYFLYGLTGLGIAFTIHYLLHFAILLILTGKRYDFNLDHSFVRIFLLCIILCAATYFTTFIDGSLIRVALLALLCTATVAYSMLHLHRKIDLLQIYESFKKKF